MCVCTTQAWRSNSSAPRTRYIPSCRKPQQWICIKNKGRGDAMGTTTRLHFPPDPPLPQNVPSVHLSQAWLTPHNTVTWALISMPVIWGSQGLVGPHLASLMSCLWWSWLIRGPDHYANEKYRGAAFYVVQLCCLCHQHTLGERWCDLDVSVCLCVREGAKQYLCTAMGSVPDIFYFLTNFWIIADSLKSI